METNKDFLKKDCQAAFDRLMEARNRAIMDLEGIVKAAGGFIPTLPCQSKPTLYVTFAYDMDMDQEAIYGIRYVEREGLFLCTKSNLDDYEYENDYCFDYLYDFEEGSDDYDAVNNAVSDLAYYIRIDNENIVRSQTVISILGGLAAYIE